VGRNTLLVYGGCCSVFLFLILLVIGLTAWSGVVAVPVLSRLYHAPVPIHTVKVKTILSVNDFMDRMQDKLTIAVQQAGGASARLEVSEAELTAGLRGLLKDPAAPSALRDIESAQIAMAGDALELFAHYHKSLFRLDILMRFKFALRQGSLVLEPDTIRLNNLPLSQDQAKRLLVSLGLDPASWRWNFSGIQLQSVGLAPGGVVVTLVPAQP
jgi:hypothetical protein